jgi:hypothetical protein
MSNISSISSSPLSMSEQIALLEEQMFRYSQFAQGSSADYKALEYAIQTHDISDAQNALARLQRDSQITAAAATATINTHSPVDSGGVQGEGSINVKA